jgi:hypothetical protein
LLQGVDKQSKKNNTKISNTVPTKKPMVNSADGEEVNPAAREGVNPAAREGVNPAAREGVFRKDVH